MVVYLYTVVAGSDTGLVLSTRDAIRFGAIQTAGLERGEWWRLFTAMFLHASPAHIAFNMIALLQLGMYLEPWYGSRRYLALYLGCGLVSSGVSAWWFWTTPIAQLGASGAIMALVGAGAVSAWRLGPRGRAFRNGLIVWGLVTIVNSVLATANNAAHIGGLLSGAFASFFVAQVFEQNGRTAGAHAQRGDPTERRRPDQLPIEIIFVESLRFEPDVDELAVGYGRG